MTGVGFDSGPAVVYFWKMRFFFVLFSVLLAVVGAVVASAQGPKRDFTDWLRFQSAESERRLLANVSPEGVEAGLVVAAPSKQAPDYFYHWVRDAALVMDVVVTLYEKTEAPRRGPLEKRIAAYIEASRRQQTTSTPSDQWGMGLGEPKFFVDGKAFDGPWGRPQNDGPALRATTLIRYAEMLLREGKREYVEKHLYRAQIPAHTLIKADLEFVSHHWKAKCFDLWEEVSGHHFYTRVVQRRALLDGARLARTLGDGGAADWYLAQAKLLEAEIRRHAQGGFLLTTLDRNGGLGSKTSGLDASTILAVMQGAAADPVFALGAPEVQETVRRLEAAFQKLYPIHRDGHPGTLIGRYPEDVYDGGGPGGNGEGNAWVLLTAAFAEWNYRLGRKVEGDRFLSRVQRHAYPDGGLSEQINRHTGFMQGAPDLTWSHAAFLTAVWQR